ncbi:MAG: hypothetical protein M0042_08520 [Nitrospiraceae bacterium]|nr:hypothetical protein [Nitrospiraceae bacterium]
MAEEIAGIRNALTGFFQLFIIFFVSYVVNSYIACQLFLIFFSPSCPSWFNPVIAFRLSPALIFFAPFAPSRLYPVFVFLIVSVFDFLRALRVVVQSGYCFPLVTRFDLLRVLRASAVQSCITF